VSDYVPPGGYGEPPARRTSWTAIELLAAELPAPRCAVDGLIVEGLTFKCGAPKLGKSWFALGLGIAVASGGYALGEIKVEKGEVLYLALEDNPRRLQDRLRLLLGSSPAPEGLFIETAWRRLDDGGLKALIAWLDQHPGTRLVVIDVWTKVRPFAHESQNRYQADYEAANYLQAIALQYGVAVLALYHTRKAESSDFVETVQGTFGTAAAADTIIVVKRARGEADATMYVTGRDVIEQELALRFAPEAGSWVLLGDAGEYALAETRKEILELVRGNGSLTPKQVSDLSEISHELAKKTMQRMFNDGQLTASSGRYSTPLSPPVPGVPVSPNEGQRDSGDTPSEGVDQLYCDLVAGGMDEREARRLARDAAARPGEEGNTT
jgi:hypothetical protein